MIVLYILLGVLFLLIMVYTVLVAPMPRKEMEKYHGARFAHRGLHDDTKAENSMSAFVAATEAGYGIELDVRLSSDGELVVFHDDTLDRVVGRPGRVDEFTADELSQMKLSGTEDGVPRFSEVLSAVGGRVPLLVEIKEDAGNSAVSEKAAEMLAAYDGEYIVESFNPLSLGTVKKKLPEACRGILSMNYQRENSEKYGKFLYYALRFMLTNRICSPAFVAYKHTDHDSISLKAAKLMGATTFAWTVRSPEEEAAAKKHGFDGVIFEGYIPEDQ